MKLTSSTVRGIHILYSFSNIFPLCASLVFTMCQTRRVNVPSAEGRDVCNIWKRVSTCGRMVSPENQTHTELRLSSFIGNSEHTLRRATRRVDWARLRIVPSFRTEESSGRPAISTTGTRKIWGFKIRVWNFSCSKNNILKVLAIYMLS